VIPGIANQIYGAVVPHVPGFCAGHGHSKTSHYTPAFTLAEWLFAERLIGSIRREWFWITIPLGLGEELPAPAF